MERGRTDPKQVTRRIGRGDVVVGGSNPHHEPDDDDGDTLAPRVPPPLQPFPATAISFPSSSKLVKVLLAKGVLCCAARLEVRLDAHFMQSPRSVPAPSPSNPTLNT